MIKASIKVSRSLDDKIKQLEEKLELAVRQRLQDIAEYATLISPVDTGAYVTSFSYGVGSGRPRGKSSHGRPRKQNPEAMKAEGLANLMEDINKIRDIKNTSRITLRNGSPHAEIVESGTSKQRGSFVFRKVLHRYNR